MLPLLLGRAPIWEEAVAPCDMLKPMVMLDIAPFKPEIIQNILIIYITLGEITWIYELSTLSNIPGVHSRNMNGCTQKNQQCFLLTKIYML